MMPLISLVVPVFNEGAMIYESALHILRAAQGEGYELELVAVDDGSKDSSAAELERARQQDARIRPYSFTRNFGKEAAILAGLAQAKGDAVVVLDCDLQHPPELIPQMVEFWRKGLYVVEAVKQDRGEEAFQDGMFARAFYMLFDRFSGMDIRNHSDFKLLDRAVVDAYLAFPEKHRFFRGIISWAQYPNVQIPFSVPERVGGGGSQWSKLKLMRYAINNLTSFSSLPLKLVSYLGGVTLAFGVVIGIISLINKFQGEAIGGFTTVNLLIIIMGGAILLSLGIIGHYLAHLYDEVKARPPYIIKPDRKSPK